MIKKTTIDKVYDAIILEDVIGDFVQLKKSGSNFKGLSPFSQEKSPSFMVSPSKQIWKDFSSGKGGNAITFIMEHEHFSYPEAIKYLAKKYNIEIEETVQSSEEKEKMNEKESMFLVSEFAQKYFHSNLYENELGKAIGYTYFIERGFTDETIKKFNLGYSIDAWQDFTDHAIKNGYKIEFLQKTGLTIVKEDKKFDRYKGRVMFPIHSMSGRVLGFGGRILTNDKKAAKYVNSPESEIYNKSKVLYGLYQAKQSIVKDENCYLVEGYTDVIQMHQAGIKNVVSSSGTALTADQIRLIKRLTNNITILYDGDEAGLRASLRGIDLILEQDLNVRICTFPKDEDPDSFSKKSTIDELTEFLKDNSQDFIKFKASLLTKLSANDPIKKAETIKDLIQSISKIPDNIKQELYIKECSVLMNVSENVLFSSLAQFNSSIVREANKKFKKDKKPFNVVKNDVVSIEKVNRLEFLEQCIIKSLLLYGKSKTEFTDYKLVLNDLDEFEYEKILVEQFVYERIFLSLQADEMDFTNNDFNQLYKILIDELMLKENFNIDELISDLPQELVKIVTDILMEEDKYQLHNWESQKIYVQKKETKIAQFVNETLLTLRKLLLFKKIDELSKNISEIEEEELRKLTFDEIKDYLNLKKLISEKLERVV